MITVPTFDDIKEGGYFTCDYEVYQKVTTWDTDGNTLLYNAIRISDDRKFYFGPDRIVEVK